MRLKKLLLSFFPFLKTISFFSLLFFTTLIILRYFNQFFQIKVVELEKKSTIDFQTILKERLKEKNWLFFSEKNEEKKIKDDYPYIKNILIEKKFPDKVVVKIDLYYPIAGIKTNDGFFILSSDGRILQKNKKLDPSLPLINYYQLINSLIYKTGNSLDFNDLKISLKLLEELKKINIKINTIDIKNEDMILFNLDDKKEIVFTSRKEIEKQIFPILIILKQIKVEGKKYKRIDVRFDKPIIKFQY